jgi:hypothetical protein
MTRINFIFHGRELDEFGFPKEFHNIIAYFSELENLGVVVTLCSIAGDSVKESFVLHPPENIFVEVWVKSKIQERFENNPIFKGLKLKIFR